MPQKKLGTWRIDRQLVEMLTGHACYGRRKKFKKNAVLYEQGEVSTRFYFVIKGLVQISIIRADGSEVVLELMGPDTICGEGSAFDGLPRFSSAVAVEDTETIEFETSKLTEAFRLHPEFAASLLRVTSLKQRVLAIRLKHLASREPQERIMELLTRLEEMFAIDHPKGRLLVTHVTHEQIAAMTGTSRVTVTRTLQRLRARGRIGILDGHIVLMRRRSG
ncbi:Crp/Fnr family transcriptional regulator [Bradyrhizobium sp. NP1]|uniref:Crp/Fnr family transcriptional regulator n=1 Tax=Bradyrhizobium sp. NP1 TaxID=3049772 RepID=UPI0025A55D0A|nr:Crp/Fnr family transcriptional regulator [Bradyrhizobium sp. NP1]WJR79963.1 Crp/Fnr family transcriptional regulator [Bradyrhizobium sp. NP1]